MGFRSSNEDAQQNILVAVRPSVHRSQLGQVVVNIACVQKGAQVLVKRLLSPMMRACSLSLRRKNPPHLGRSRWDQISVCPPSSTTRLGGMRKNSVASSAR